MLKNKTLWVGIVVSLVLVGFLFYGTDFHAISEVFRTANYIYLIPALILYFFGVFLRSVRWHFLLRSIKPVRLWRLFQVTVIGYMANDILPFRIGELVRAYLLGETEQISKASVLVTIVLERVFDGVTMLLFIGVASLFIAVNDYIRTMLFFGTALFSIAIVVLVVFAGSRERLDVIIHHVSKRLPEKWATRGVGLVDSFFHGLSVLRSPFDSLMALLFSIFAWLAEATMYAVLALGFGIALPYPVFVLATAVANLVTIIPSTPGYIGVFDAPIKSVLTLFGVNPNVAASYALFLHAVLVFPVVLLGFIFLWRLGLSLGQLQKKSTGAEISLENV